MAAFTLHRESPAFAAINVTPLVDVMLVLLIILMLAAPLLTHRLTLHFASTLCPAQGCPKAGDPVTLSIKATGELYWNGMALTQGEVAQNLATIAQAVDHPALTLRPDAHVRYALVAQVLAAAKNAEVERIAIEPAH